MKTQSKLSSFSILILTSDGVRSVIGGPMIYRSPFVIGQHSTWWMSNGHPYLYRLHEDPKLLKSCVNNDARLNVRRGLLQTFHK